MSNAQDGPVCAINLLSLRPAVTLNSFARFSSELDQPVCLAQDVVLGFDAYAVQRREPGAGGFDVVEVVTVRSWSEWERVLQGPELEPVIAGFGKLVAGDTVRTVFGTRIQPRA
jgi:hypothetical protein